MSVDERWIIKGLVYKVHTMEEDKIFDTLKESLKYLHERWDGLSVDKKMMMLSRESKDYRYGISLVERRYGDIGSGRMDEPIVENMYNIVDSIQEGYVDVEDISICP